MANPYHPHLLCVAGLVVALATCVEGAGSASDDARSADSPVVVVLDPARAGTVGEGSLPDGWVERAKLGARGRRRDVEVRRHADRQAVCLRGDRASFSIDRHLEIDLRRTPIVEWEWLVLQHPERGDMRDDATDDQAAQLLLTFKAGLLSYKVVSYVWDPVAPVGTVREQRRTMLGRGVTSRIVVVDSGTTDTGSWHRHRRNALQDARELIGDSAPVVSIVRYQANSQYTGDQAESCIARITFATERQARRESRIAMREAPAPQRPRSARPSTRRASRSAPAPGCVRSGCRHR